MSSQLFEYLAIGCFVAFSVVASVLLTLAVRGRLVAAPPRCATCGQLTGAAEFERSGACPECGADLRREDGVRYFRRKRSAILFVLGILALLMALAVPLGFRFLNHLMLRGPTVAPTTSFASLLEYLREGSVSNGPAMQEFARRVNNRELSSDEFASAVDAMVVGYEKTEGPWFSNEAQTIVAAAVSDKAITAAQLGRLGDRVFPKLSLRIRERIRSGVLVDPRLYGGDSYGNLQRRFAIVGVKADDQPLPLERMDGQGVVDRIETSSPLSAGIRFALPPGSHNVIAAFEMQYFVVSPGTMAQPGTTPDGVSTMTSGRRVDVVAADAPPIVALMTDATHGVLVRSACIARRIAIDPFPTADHRMIRADVDVGVVAELSLVYRVLVRIDGTEYDLGTLRASDRNGNVTKSGAGLAKLQRTPSESATEATVIFRPDPMAVEDDPDVDAIWGEEFVVEHVPIVRGSAVR